MEIIVPYKLMAREVHPYMFALTQRIRDVIIASLLRQHGVAKSFCHVSSENISSEQFSTLRVTHFYNGALQTYQLRIYQHSTHFEDDIFKLIFVSENCRIVIRIAVYLVPYGPTHQAHNKPTLILIMAWCRAGDPKLPKK